MYPLEKYMKYMKSYVHNKAHLEGFMATGTTMEVGLGLLMKYILEFEFTKKRIWNAKKEVRNCTKVTYTAYKVRTLLSEEY